MQENNQHKTLVEGFQLCYILLNVTNIYATGMACLVIQFLTHHKTHGVCAVSNHGDHVFLLLVHTVLLIPCYFKFCIYL